MPLDIPYTFIAGTKAKASEVNSNFQAVKTITDQNEVNIAQAEIDITTLQTTKADLNGAIENRFQVADPSGNYDAVNKQYFDNMIANVKPYINGFRLSKYDNTTISATPGSCYDSTGEYIFTSASALQVSQSNLGANATYYVYIAGGPDVDNELVISSSDTTPELPAGAEYFRLLGSFTTDEESHIYKVLSLTNSLNSSDINLYACMPNYRANETRRLNVEYTEATAGYAWVRTIDRNNATATITVDGFPAYTTYQWKYVQKQQIMVPVAPGSTWKCTGSYVEAVGWIPCIGG